MFVFLLTLLLLSNVKVNASQDVWDWSKIQENEKVTCIYKPENVFSCRGLDGIIDCSSNSTISIKFKSLDMGKCNNTQDAMIGNSSTLKICFYQNDLNSQDSSQDAIKINTNIFPLYYADVNSNVTYTGIRILDFKCYNRLVEFIQSSAIKSFNSEVHENIENQKETLEMAPIFGEFINFNDFMKKRHNHAMFKRHSHEFFSIFTK